MAIDIKKVLESMKKTYEFVVKIAADDEEKPDFTRADRILKAKGMIRRSNLKSLPIGSLPTEFKRLEGFCGLVYVCDMEFEYPITPSELTNEICTLLSIDKAFVVVRTTDNPLEKDDENYLNFKDEDYIPQLVQDEMKTNVNPEDYYGDKYNAELVKKLQSKEAKEYQQNFKEVDKKMYKGQ